MAGPTEEVLEQVPLYTLTNLDDGKQEKLLLVVQLPGVQSATELEVRTLDDLISVRAPGRYKLDLDLPLKISNKAEVMNFSKKKAVLKAEFLVTGKVTKGKGATRPTSAPSSTPGAKGEPKGPQANGAAGNQRGVHDSFLADAMKLRDGKEKKPPRSKSPASPVDEGLPKNGKSSSGKPGDPASSAAPATPTPASAVPGRGVPPLGREAQAPRTPASGDRTGDKDARSLPEATPGKPPNGFNRGDEAASASSSSHREPDLSHGARARSATGGRPVIMRVPGSGGAQAAANGSSHRDASLSSCTESESEDESSDDEGDSGASDASMPSLDSVDDDTHRADRDAKSSERVPTERPSVPYANPELQASNREAGEECHMRARMAMTRGDIPAAIRLLTKATGLDPLNPVYHRELAEALEEQLGATPGRSQRDEAPQKREPAHEQPQDRTRAGRSTKAGSSRPQKKANAGQGTPESKPAAPKTPPPPPTPEPRAPSPEPVRTDPQRTWESALEGFNHDWVTGVFGISLVMADSIGLTKVADTLYAESQVQGPGVTLLTLLLLLIIVGVGGLFLLRAVAPAGFSAAKWGMAAILSLLGYLLYPLSWCLAFVLSTLHTVFWRPPWWTSIPIAFLVTCWEDSLMAMLWSYPLTWWLTGGRWWFLYGTPLTFGLSLLLRCPFYGTNLWLVIVRCSFVYLRWWAATAVMLVGFVALLLYGVEVPQRNYRAAKLAAEIPDGAVGEVARILGASDYYEVLEVDRAGDEAAVRKAKRVKVLLVHPDKLAGDAAIGAAEAFHRVTEAHDTLSDQRLRQKYDKELAEAERLEQASSRYEDGSSEGVAILSMDCPRCEARGIRDACHTAHRISRPMHAARYCREHDTYHEASPGDIWLESSGLWGYRAYLCSTDMVLDITDWVHCNKVNFKARYGGLARDTHWPLTSTHERSPDDVRSPRSSQTGSQQGKKKKGGKGGRNRGRR